MEQDRQAEVGRGGFQVRRARGGREELQPQQKRKAHPLEAEPSWLCFRKTRRGSQGLAAGLQQVALPLPAFQQLLQGQRLPGPARDQRLAVALNVLVTPGLHQLLPHVPSLGFVLFFILGFCFIFFN